MTETLLLADFFENIIGAIFLILWVAAQILGGRQEMKKKAKPPQPRAPEPQPIDLAGGNPRPGNPRPPAPAVPRNQEEALRSEVEEFLRRAQGKSPQPEPKPQPVSQRKPPPPRPKPQPRPVVVPEKARTLRTEGVAEHVSRHLSTQEIDAQTKTLGAEVALSDDRLESHLHRKFDHKIGSLDHHETRESALSKEGDIAAQVAAMLRSPQGMRQVIIANEILRRPEW